MILRNRGAAPPAPQLSKTLHRLKDSLQRYFASALRDGRHRFALFWFRPPAPRVCKTPFPQMTSGIRFLALQHPSVHGSTGGGLSLGDFPSALVPLLGHGPSSLGCPPGPVAMHSTAGLSVGLVGQSLIAPFQKHGAGRRHTATRSDRPGKIVFRRGKDRVGQLPRWAGRHSVSQGRSFPVSGNVGIPDTARHASR